MDNQKVILITGCSSGFGLLTAVRLASRGHFVWATMRNLSKRQELDNALSKHNAQAAIRELDVIKPSTIKNVVAQILEKHGHIDVLINNAGYGIAGFFEDLSQEEIRAQMETNFFGVQNVCREVIPLMRKFSKGKIINISSVAGLVSNPSFGAYSTSKWALEAFSESLYYELGLFGISVSLVEPGSYPTEFFSRMFYAKNFDDPQSPYFAFSQKLKGWAGQNIGKLKRDPNDIAHLIESVVDAPRPKLRYISDISSWMRVKAQKVLPPPLILNLFRRMTHANQ